MFFYTPLENQEGRAEGGSLAAPPAHVCRVGNEFGHVSAGGPHYPTPLTDMRGLGFIGLGLWGSPVNMQWGILLSHILVPVHGGVLP